jgi:hypothetical protein
MDKRRWIVPLAAAGLAAAILVPAGISQAAPGVYFENAGSIAGWDYHYTQKKGIIRNVAGPSFKGGNAIEAKQTYINETGGYHSEVIERGAQAVGQDRYYGQAIYLPPGWQFHNQNVTFQQWSPEKPEGPWLLMFVQNNQIRFGGSGGISGTAATISRGAWIRVVTRLKLAAAGGAFEVWINGKKVHSRTGRILPKQSKTIRWSSGIYCTAWREGKPAGGGTLSIFHDQARIAASYALAEPANW